MNPVDLFYLQNPWRQNTKFQVTPFFERAVLHKIEAWLDEPEIIVLIGPRQSGKTTLLMKLVERQLAQAKQPQELLYFSCDNPQIQSLFLDITDFIRFIKQVGAPEHSFIIIDEIQKISEPGVFLKQLYDLKIGYKFIVSGSSSLEIRSKIAEPLTGRKIAFTVFPLNFREFLQADMTMHPLLNTPLTEISNGFASIDKMWGMKLRKTWEDFMIYGGYPRLMQTTNFEKKAQLLDEIYSSYIQKDITDFIKIDNISGFNKTVQLLAFNSGQIINKSSLAMDAGISTATLDKYLQVLKDTYVINEVMPFFTNKAKEIIKNPKVYFVDQGLRNDAMSNLNSLAMRADQGFMQENFIYNELRAILMNGTGIKFWRTKVGAEVDFIIDLPGNPIPIECKSRLRKPVIGRGFRNFLKHYRPKWGMAPNSDHYTEQYFEGIPILFIPYRWFTLLGKAALIEKMNNG